MKVFQHTPKSFFLALEAGVFGKQNVELLGGFPRVITSNPPHGHAGEQLARLLRIAFPESSWKVREEKYVRLGSWAPQPDVAVIRCAYAAYMPGHPGPSEIRLIAEVSDTSYGLDRGLKFRKYASVGIPEYWIVDLEARLIQVFTEPEGAGKAARYRTALDYDETMTILPPADAVEAIAVADVLPPRGARP